MKFSILYFEGCPNHPPVVEKVRRILAERGVASEIEEVEVSPEDVARYRFLGSPTVQVEGVDIEPAARDRTDFAMSCRVYDTPDGLPPEQLIVSALPLDEAFTASQSRHRAGRLAIGGSLATAILSSACCWVPLLLIVFGTSAAGASAFFERWRLVFVVMAVAMLALGFHLSYFRNRSCAEGCCSTPRQRGRRLQRAMLWVSAVVVAAFIFFPSYVGLVLSGSGSTATGNSTGVIEMNAIEYVFEVEGMHCEGCAAALRNTLAGIDGVVDAKVDFQTRTAIVRGEGDQLDERVADAASRIGFTAKPRRQ